MPPSTLSRPPGFHDRTAQEAAEAASVVNDLQRVMTGFGYQIIETPIVEYADLFLTKSGDEAVNRLFNFEMYGRNLCLRSEFTASAARLYVERFQHEPKPIRWQFAGPVFRYESPQRSHSRQFTMIGTELIGPSGVGGDAEAVGLAARGLLKVGLQNWTLVIGHVGLVAALLDRFDLDRRMRRFILGHIENLRRRGRAYVEEQIAKLYAGLPDSLQRIEEMNGEVEIDAHGEMSRVLQLLLESANLGSTGSGRSNEDIARRLLNKQRRASQHTEILRALDFLEKLTAIEGPPSDALPKLEAILPEVRAIQETAQDFRAALDLLPAYGIEPERIRVDMGLARGLNYYTGLVFEAHTEVGDSASQLCGGGRYDDFIRVLGAAHDTPAVGFAYGLERILQERRRAGQTVMAEGVTALVVPVNDADNAAAAQVAMALRAQMDVELFTPPTRNLSQALALADKRGTPYVIIIGEAERAANQITVRDMRKGTQFTHGLDALGSLVPTLQSSGQGTGGQ